MFINKMQDVLNDEFNYSTTENGAKAFRTTGKNLLDLNFKVASLRKSSEEEIQNLFAKAFYEDKELACKWAFYARDVRGGLGERRLFREILKYLATNHKELAEKFIEFVPEYGRFDDLFALLSCGIDDKIANIIFTQLHSDIANMKIGKSVSLLAKWMPSENASSATTKENAHKIRNYLGLTPRNYRKILTDLRKYIDIVERKMSAKEWEKINYETVPSRANLIYNKAFLRNDEKRRREYLGSLEKGEAKINSSVLFPHDIIHKYTKRGYRTCVKDIALEAMWKVLPDYVKGNGNTIVVADGSGSMMSCIGNTNISALSVANALAIYFAERSSGQFKDNYITFSSHPQLIDFSKCNSLKEKIELALRYDECSNTNIEAVFDLILTTAIKNKMKQEELPSNILVISDMEFDSATSGNTNDRLFRNIAKRYESNGYKIPRLVFWNVNSRTGAIPVIENDLGIALVSGFSPAIVNMVLSNETDPYKCLVKVLNSERYEKIKI